MGKKPSNHLVDLVASDYDLHKQYEHQLQAKRPNGNPLFNRKLRRQAASILRRANKRMMNGKEVV